MGNPVTRLGHPDVAGTLAGTTSLDEAARQERLRNEKLQDEFLQPLERGFIHSDVSNYKTYYYSGGQAQIYMDDVFLDELTSLSFQTVTNKSPIYGYASQYFDTVAKGNLIVYGQLSINFVEAGYLPIIAHHLQRDTLDGDFGDAFKTLPGKGQWDSAGFTDWEVGQAMNQIKGMGNAEFLELANKLRKSRNKSPIPNKFYSIPPFEIYAVFGDHADPSAQHTVRRIKRVHLTGQSQVVETSGQPIQEAYTFLARDIE